MYFLLLVTDQNHQSNSSQERLTLSDLNLYLKYIITGIIGYDSMIVPFSISCVKCAIHTGTLEARMMLQVTRMASLVIGTVLREMEDTGNTTARNLDMHLNTGMMCTNV